MSRSTEATIAGCGLLGCLMVTLCGLWVLTVVGLVVTGLRIFTQGDRGVVTLVIFVLCAISTLSGLLHRLRA